MKHLLFSLLIISSFAWANDPLDIHLQQKNHYAQKRIRDAKHKTRKVKRTQPGWHKNQIKKNQIKK